MNQSFDVVVIGTGTAAATVASRCRKAGRTVAIVDELPFGGTCALRGCDPKKMLRRGPEVVDAVQRMEGNGVVRGGLHVDWPALVAFKRGFTDSIPEQRERSFREQGMATFHGTARFTGEKTVAIGDDLLEGGYIVIASGAKPRPLEIPGENLVITSTQFMEIENLPRRILFIGGGYISFEFAHMAARAGAEVTVLTRGDRPLGGFDPDLVDRLVERSTSTSIHLQVRADVQAVERSGDALRVRALIADKGQTLDTDLVVHGAGRVPAIDALDLAKANVRAGKKGVEVNEFLQSVSNPAVYAAGDAAATAGAPLTPVSSLEGKIAATNLLESNRVRANYTGIPSVVFTIPALTRVGLLESKAHDQRLDYTPKLTDMAGWITVRRVGETHAAAKTLIENGTGRILGAHLLGPQSSELINLFALAMRSGLPVGALKDFVSAYPTAASDIGYLV